MKKIYNVSIAESRNIYQAIADHGGDLISVAELAEANKKYGIALSLYILGAEEYAKAFIMLFHSIGVKVFDIHEIKKAFYNHKKKHEVAILIQLTQFIKTFEEAQTWNQRRKKRKARGNTTLVNRFVAGLIEMGPILGDIARIGFNISWWDMADSYKNRGFYVDYNDILELPSDINIEDINTAKPAIVELIKQFNYFKDEIKESSNEELELLVADLNKGIELYISNSEKTELETS